MTGCELFFQPFLVLLIPFFFYFFYPIDSATFILLELLLFYFPPIFFNLPCNFFIISFTWKVFFSVCNLCIFLLLFSESSFFIVIKNSRLFTEMWWNTQTHKTTVKSKGNATVQRTSDNDDDVRRQHRP